MPTPVPPPNGRHSVKGKTFYSKGPESIFKVTDTLSHTKGRTLLEKELERQAQEIAQAEASVY